MVNSNCSPENLKRLFIGIKIPLTKNLISFHKSVQDELAQSRIKWTKTENFHLTIRFLGNIPEKYIDSINSIISNALTNCSSFNLSLKNLGFFGENKPKILWLGITENNALTKIYNEINENLTFLRFKLPEYKFHPHITLGRIKHLHAKSSIEQICGLGMTKTEQQFCVNEICLFESELKSDGPIYKVLNKHYLI